MSYILEALKQAEEERGSDRLSKALPAQPVEDVQQQSVDWKKWLTIAIFVNAIVLFAWVAWKFVAITADTDANTESESLATVNNISNTEETEPLSSVNATITTEETTEPRSSIESTVSTEKTVPVIANPAEPQVQATVSASIQPLPNLPEEKSVQEITPVVKEEIISNKMAASKLEKPTSLPADSEQSQVMKKPSAVASATKPAKPILATPLIKADINTPKVEPLPATPREQLVIEAEPELAQPTPEIIEPEVVEPEVTEPEVVEPEVVAQIVAVERPPVPEFAELPYSLQQKIPEIRISVHIFNSEPQQRKVRINGQIFREGDEVARNLWVEEITPRGVIFDYNQTVFRQNLH